MTFILVVDQSTSAVKAMLFGDAAHLLEYTSVTHEQVLPKASWVEYDHMSTFSELSAFDVVFSGGMVSGIY